MTGVHRLAVPLSAALLALVVTSGTAHGAPGGAAGRPPTGFHVVAQVPLAQPREVAAGAKEVWVLSGSTTQTSSALTRIDKKTSAVTATYAVSGRNGGGLAVGFGSVWVSLRDANQVARIDPASGAVQARIRVGRQPGVLHVAFGSVWSGDRASGRLSRIDPVTNAVTSTLPLGTVEDISDDGHVLYVATSPAGSDTDGSLDTIDPATTTLTDDWPVPDDHLCGDLVPVGGFVWTVDRCTNTLWQLYLQGHNRGVFTYGSAAINSATYLRGLIWTAVDTDGTGFIGGRLQARKNVSGGAVLASFDIGGDARVVRGLFGDLWVLDQTNGTVRRIALTT